MWNGDPRTPTAGVARLRLVADECQDGLAGLRLPLTKAFDDPSQYAPQDCLADMLASVQGCRLSMVSLVTASKQLRNFSCSSWLQYQGWVANGECRLLRAAKGVCFDHTTPQQLRGATAFTEVALKPAPLPPCVALNPAAQTREHGARHSMGAARLGVALPASRGSPVSRERHQRQQAAWGGWPVCRALHLRALQHNLGGE